MIRSRARTPTGSGNASSSSAWASAAADLRELSGFGVQPSPDERRDLPGLQVESTARHRPGDTSGALAAAVDAAETAGPRHAPDSHPTGQ
jgi:mevalonate pyrophosphate decarboxylase